MPATVNAGDLLVMFIKTAGAGAHDQTQPSGWSTIIHSTVNQTQYKAGIYVKDAVGDEDGTNVDVETDGASNSASAVVRIQTGTWGGTVGTDIEGTAGSVVGTATPNPPSHTATWGSDDNLFFGLNFYNNDGGTITVYPSNFPDNRTEVQSGGNANEMGALMYCSLESATADANPGQITIDESEQNLPYTLVIKPAASSSVLGPMIIPFGDI
jgi:hypothetical protein